MPGPNLIYACPVCGQGVEVGSTSSGNNFRAILYSDCMEVAPFFPYHPNETKCHKCGTIFDFNEETFVNDLANILFSTKNLDEFWKYCNQLEGATFLSVEDYQKKIELKNGCEESNRLKMWHTANGTYGGYDPLSVDSEQYIDNCKKLIEMLKETNNSKRKIILAELYRNIGDFESCVKIISNMEEEYDWLKEPYLENCRCLNKSTFVLRRNG
ncbi:MAG: hypothetical protein GXY10_04375 [Clostridiales bacterium]|nr:hypothetical protein [Clostridiales bacterium]